MDEFVRSYPAVVLWLVGILFGGVCSLFAVLGFFIKMSLDNLIAAIKELQAAIQDKTTEIDLLKERMKAQETTCTMQRDLCPGDRRHNHLENQTFIPQDPVKCVNG